MGSTCGVAREGGVCIHMQYIIHGLYFMKRNNEKDRLGPLPLGTT